VRKDKQGSTAAERVPPRLLRCAIYTRKSTEEGLEQEFNSLAAQREAAEAFIESQGREGWIVLPEHYDDGGFSGANMDRPALVRLLEAVAAGALDCVVVYKVDRLSRSLLDFARLMNLFEQHNVSFVSVTQQFNTNTSLGRLTLNIVLSFAQFEQELIGERTRDKMSAARRKGKWLGGCPVLGYDIAVGGGKLIVNQAEAERVRTIFALFAEHRSILLTLAELERRGWRLKSWTSKKGQFRAGRPFTQNSLWRLLTNITYTGVVGYKGAIYEGEHEAILAADTWQRVQDLLVRSSEGSGHKPRNKQHALLAGLLRCEACGRAMIPTCSVKKNRRYRYYVCLNARQNRSAACPGQSVAALQIETSIVEGIEAHIRGGDFGPEWQALGPVEKIEFLRSVIAGVTYNGATHRVCIRFRSGCRYEGGRTGVASVSTDLELAYRLDTSSEGGWGRAAGEGRLDAPANGKDTCIPRIARLIALAIRYEGLVREGAVRDYAELARLGEVTRARITQIMNLLWLAPDVQERLLFLEGSQAAAISMNEASDRF
jgi:DNA invertase Pin-like site-specific DNA recombinase